MTYYLLPLTYDTAFNIFMEIIHYCIFVIYTINKYIKMYPFLTTFIINFVIFYFAILYTVSKKMDIIEKYLYEIKKDKQNQDRKIEELQRKWLINLDNKKVNISYINEDDFWKVIKNTTFTLIHKGHVKGILIKDITSNSENKKWVYDLVEIIPNIVKVKNSKNEVYFILE